MTEITRCGYIAIMGQPNAGKSTLLNHILGQKISITSRKPQTTRDQIIGVKTFENTQAIYVDTPGLHRNNKNALNRHMNRAASSMINNVNIIVFMVVANHWTEEDDWILEKFQSVDCPVVLVLNKIDKLKDRERLLPLLKEYGEKFNFAALVPMSARSPDDAYQLEKVIAELLPEGKAQFPEDQITDRSEKFMIAETVREKIMRNTGAEVPYSVALEVEQYEYKENVLHLSVLILVDKASHKGIIIGEKGARLKEIGTQARIDLERLLDTKVFLRLWIKVREGWADDERALKSLGYGE
jgi:GTP-binding protein Era